MCNSLFIDREPTICVYRSVLWASHQYISTVHTYVNLYRTTQSSTAWIRGTGSCWVVLYHISVEDAGLKPLCPPLYNILQYNYYWWRLGNDGIKICRWLLNVPMDGASLMDSGIAFQMTGSKLADWLWDWHKVQLREVVYSRMLWRVECCYIIHLGVGQYFQLRGNNFQQSPITSINYLFCYTSNNHKIRHTVNNFTWQVIMTSLCVS